MNTKSQPSPSPVSRPSSRKVIDRHLYVPHYLVVLANGMERGQSRIYLKHFGIGINEARIITVVAHSGPLTAAEISEILVMNKSITSRSMQILEGRGLVTVGDSPRSRPITLTEEGYALHDRIVAVSLAREALLLDGFSPNEKTIVLGYLARMASNMELANAIDPLAVERGETPTT
ncbi:MULTISPECIES: MarR family transcriptional regulator [unclassified Novosphingobium]|uniref:MarR family winged helix-turn-helix transcriptional regulator n=1 Tax=unclassified Novosphingobium TaxID=2644732 RepID=UPI001469B962|nr:MULTISPECIES: MarR family transcriptional regulator [unclassified Novosphingobium]NMN05244.1 DNA-binding MarR family transcriptional regulator [Novosphingobium sp. SG919]NMN87539.1 DNA-binding MarR family transcriptional regulator [Novosphingobium sp. SG916]